MFFGLLALAWACGADDQSSTTTDTPDSRIKGEPGKSDASDEAVFLDFAFDGEVFATSSWSVEASIEDQMLYTIGLLNGERSVGRLDKLQLSNVQTEPEENGVRITYHAQMPVAWGRKESVPTSYSLRLPRDMSYQGQESFTDKYMHDCVDWSAHDVDVGSMWYYYRPDAYNCQLDAADVIEAEATVTPSTLATTGKFPEYDKLWEDGVLKVVAIFGKYEEGATSNSDPGISSYNKFVRQTRDALQNVETTPAEVPSLPGVDLPDVEIRGQLDDGHRLQVNVLLVENVRTAGAAFDDRYHQLTPEADLIAYNGHSGLGANIRALASKGQWVSGQYAVVFMNGCDTYAYVDSSLADAHAAVNPDDPVGTKYVDIVMNAMPSPSARAAEATMTLMDGLMAFDEPRTYEQIFARMNRSQVVLVSGEEDNTYVPGGGGGGGGEAWEGMEAEGTVAAEEEAHYETPEVKAGRYLFTLSGDNDADLYVRIGAKPTTSEYDCRPYLSGSSESCEVDLPAATKIFVMVRGWADSSSYRLEGQPSPQ
jgi:hypothetical protein